MRGNNSFLLLLFACLCLLCGCSKYSAQGKYINALVTLEPPTSSGGSFWELLRDHQERLGVSRAYRLLNRPKYAQEARDWMGDVIFVMNDDNLTAMYVPSQLGMPGSESIASTVLNFKDAPEKDRAALVAVSSVINKGSLCSRLVSDSIAGVSYIKNFNATANNSHSKYDESSYNTAFNALSERMGEVEFFCLQLARETKEKQKAQDAAEMKTKKEEYLRSIQPSRVSRAIEMGRDF